MMHGKSWQKNGEEKERIHESLRNMGSTGRIEPTTSKRQRLRVIYWQIDPSEMDLSRRAGHLDGCDACTNARASENIRTLQMRGWKRFSSHSNGASATCFALSTPQDEADTFRRHQRPVDHRLYYYSFVKRSLSLILRLATQFVIGSGWYFFSFVSFR